MLVRPLGYSEPAGTELFALGMRQGCANELYTAEAEGLVSELTLNLCPGYHLKLGRWQFHEKERPLIAQLLSDHATGFFAGGLWCSSCSELIAPLCRRLFVVVPG